LAESVGLPFAAETGVRQSEKENENVLGCLSVNEVGEKASGLEEIPTRSEVDVEQFSREEGASYVLAGPLKTRVMAPRVRLPEDSIVVSCKSVSGAKHAAQTAKMALEILGRQGDAKIGAWSVMPAPVFLVCDGGDRDKGSSDSSTAEKILDVSKDVLENVGVMVLENAEDQNVAAAFGPSSRHMRAASAYPHATHVGEYIVSGNLLDDASPSTIGVAGVYVGSVMSTAADQVEDGEGVLPHGEGIMTWENGISYQGSWCDGVFHGLGAKMYSKGGGFIGRWKFGKREGLGISLYEGKWNYDQWEGPFKNDKAHGMGIMRPIDGEPFPFEFVEGQPVNVKVE
jgi:hypothetical protein